MNLLATYWQKLYRSTPAELAIEPAIAALGVQYRTQFPFYLWGVKLFPDFLLPTIGVILEVDDPSHEEPEKRKADREKEAFYERIGYRVVRCTNEEALSDPHGTVERLIRPLLGRVGPGLPTNPSPRRRRQKRK